MIEATSKCRDCDQPIIWAQEVEVKNGEKVLGKNRPFDPQPKEGGEYELKPNSKGKNFFKWIHRNERGDDALYFMHFKTCPKKPGNQPAQKQENDDLPF